MDHPVITNIRDSLFLTLTLSSVTVGHEDFAVLLLSPLFPSNPSCQDEAKIRGVRITFFMEQEYEASETAGGRLRYRKAAVEAFRHSGENCK